MSQKTDSAPSSVVHLSSVRTRKLDELAHEKGDVAQTTQGKSDQSSDDISNNFGGWAKLLPGVALREFKPCVVYYEGIRATEMLIEDCSIVWCPWGPPGHAVDLGYSNDGRLVGIRIWDDVYERKLHPTADENSAMER